MSERPPSVLLARVDAAGAKPGIRRGPESTNRKSFPISISRDDFIKNSITVWCTAGEGKVISCGSRCRIPDSRDTHKSLFTRGIALTCQISGSAFHQSPFAKVNSGSRSSWNAVAVEGTVVLAVLNIEKLLQDVDLHDPRTFLFIYYNKSRAVSGFLVKRGYGSWCKRLTYFPDSSKRVKKFPPSRLVGRPWPLLKMISSRKTEMHDN